MRPHFFHLPGSPRAPLNNFGLTASPAQTPCCRLPPPPEWGPLPNQMKSEWYTPALVPRFNIPLPPQPVFRPSPFPQTDFAYARANMMRRWGGGLPYGAYDASGWSPYGAPSTLSYASAAYPARTPWTPPGPVVFLETDASGVPGLGSAHIDGMAHSRMAKILALHRALRADSAGAAGGGHPDAAALVAELTSPVSDASGVSAASAAA